MTSRRERALFWGAVLLLLLGTAVAYRLVLGPEPGSAAAPLPPVAAPEPLRLTVARAVGEVTIVRAGVRTKAVAGDALRQDDAIETALGARVELSGGRYEVALEEGGHFAVQEITAELSRFVLGSGLVSARVDDDPTRAIEIEAAPDAVARTTGGEIAVARSGRVVAVGVRRGGAEFRSGGRAVTLREGQQSFSQLGAAPSPPAPLPSSLLLKVNWPEERTTNSRRMIVTGRAAPGTIVIVGDERVEVKPDGRFEHVIVLTEGPQRLSARAHGVAGSTVSPGPAVVLDTRAPDARFDTRDLWSKPSTSSPPPARSPR